MPASNMPFTAMHKSASEASSFRQNYLGSDSKSLNISISLGPVDARYTSAPTSKPPLHQLGRCKEAAIFDWPLDLLCCMRSFFPSTLRSYY